MAPVGSVATLQIGTGLKGHGLDKHGTRRHLCQPRGLHVFADGSIVVADFGNNCCYRFKRGDVKGEVFAGQEGKPLPSIDPLKDIDKAMCLPEEEGLLLKQPGDVCECPAGGVYVLDTDEACIQVFDGRGRGKCVMPVGGKSVHKSLGTPEAIKNPRGFTVAPDGALVVCDTWSHRVLRFPPPGSSEENDKPIVVGGTPNNWGKGPHQLAFPSCVFVDSDGAFLVADTNNHRIQRFELGREAGMTIAGSADCQRGSGLHQLDMPTGVCRDRDGSLLVTDRANSRVLRFPAGSKAGTEGAIVVGSELVAAPWGICATPDGAIYVSDDRDAVILKIEAEGSPVPPRPRGRAPPRPVDPAPNLTAETPATSAELEVESIEEGVPPRSTAKAADLPVVSGSPDELD